MAQVPNNNQVQQMPALKLFAWGALGGALPILATLVKADLVTLIDEDPGLTLGVCIGYTVRVVVLIFLGGIMAVLNPSVMQPLTLVQIGIAAPALVTSYINSAPPPQKTAALISIISRAYAAEGSSQNAPVQLAGFWSDFRKGLVRPLSQVDRPPTVSPGSSTYPFTVPGADTGPEPADNSLGRYCATSKGRFGPGPINPKGMLCKVDTGAGTVAGFVRGKVDD